MLLLTTLLLALRLSLADNPGLFHLDGQQLLLVANGYLRTVQHGNDCTKDQIAAVDKFVKMSGCEALQFRCANTTDGALVQRQAWIRGPCSWPAAWLDSLTSAPSEVDPSYIVATVDSLDALSPDVLSIPTFRFAGNHTMTLSLDASASLKDCLLYGEIFGVADGCWTDCAACDKGAVAVMTNSFYGHCNSCSIFTLSFIPFKGDMHFGQRSGDRVRVECLPAKVGECNTTKH
jgi:hypothetical protein